MQEMGGKGGMDMMGGMGMGMMGEFSVIAKAASSISGTRLITCSLCFAGGMGMMRRLEIDLATGELYDYEEESQEQTSRAYRGQ
jgi:hypothetical protein